MIPWSCSPALSELPRSLECPEADHQRCRTLLWSRSSPKLLQPPSKDLPTAVRNRSLLKFFQHRHLRANEHNKNLLYKYHKQQTHGKCRLYRCPLAATAPIYSRINQTQVCFLLLASFSKCNAKTTISIKNLF